MQTKNTNGKSGRLRSLSQRSLVFRSVQQAGNHARDPVLQAGPYAPSLSGNPQW
jgi:hypothetical protein